MKVLSIINILTGEEDEPELIDDTEVVDFDGELKLFKINEFKLNRILRNLYRVNKTINFDIFSLENIAYDYEMVGGADRRSIVVIVN